MAMVQLNEANAFQTLKMYKLDNTMTGEGLSHHFEHVWFMLSYRLIRKKASQQELLLLQKKESSQKLLQ